MFLCRERRASSAGAPLILRKDPPPDVVVEVDTTNESLSKFNIYAALAVPEIWRYDGKRTYMHSLARRSYTPISESLSFPGLTIEMVAEFMEDAKLRSQTKALAAFRKRLRGRKRSTK